MFPVCVAARCRHRMGRTSSLLSVNLRRAVLGLLTPWRRGVTGVGAALSTQLSSYPSIRLLFHGLLIIRPFALCYTSSVLSVTCLFSIYKWRMRRIDAGLPGTSNLRHLAKSPPRRIPFKNIALLCAVLPFLCYEMVDF